MMLTIKNAMTSQNALYKKVISKLAKNAKILLCKNKKINY